MSLPFFKLTAPPTLGSQLSHTAPPTLGISRGFWGLRRWFSAHAGVPIHLHSKGGLVRATAHLDSLNNWVLWGRFSTGFWRLRRWFSAHAGVPIHFHSKGGPVRAMAHLDSLLCNNWVLWGRFSRGFWGLRRWFSAHTGVPIHLHSKGGLTPSYNNWVLWGRFSRGLWGLRWFSAHAGVPIHLHTKGGLVLATARLDSLFSDTWVFWGSLWHWKEQRLMAVVQDFLIFRTSSPVQDQGGEGPSTLALY
ncbi:hypothetical protein F4604DRAFT_1681809 [Suillus subluteus]|nr:hypothetical protein F4604DRAFT_1681809 [Suillus subluteus]